MTFVVHLCSAQVYNAAVNSGLNVGDTVFKWVLEFHCGPSPVQLCTSCIDNLLSLTCKIFPHCYEALQCAKGNNSRRVGSSDNSITYVKSVFILH